MPPFGRNLKIVLYLAHLCSETVPKCSMLPLDYELMCRCAKFMNNCLISGNDVVSYVARHGIFFQRMFSPIGRNAQRCCETAGLSLSDLYEFNKQSVFQVVYSSLPDWVMPTVSVVLELIQIRWNCRP